MKVRLDGVDYEYDPSKLPMSEAMAFEEKTGIRFAEWEQDIKDGALRGLCGLAWLIWYRNGAEKPFADIVAGKIDFDLGELSRSLQKARAEAEAAAEHPTRAVPRSEPGGTAGKHGTTHRR